MMYFIDNKYREVLQLVNNPYNSLACQESVCGGHFDANQSSGWTECVLVPVNFT